jgi:hypothetical protein
MPCATVVSRQIFELCGAYLHAPPKFQNFCGAPGKHAPQKSSLAHLAVVRHRTFFFEFLKNGGKI